GATNNRIKCTTFCWHHLTLTKLCNRTILSTYPNGEHALLSGTSMAAPKVSGTIALIIDKYNMKKKPNKAINFLYNYGIDKTKENKNLYGNGMLDVYNAVSK
ncbi:S8 family serine peptidase, partial [Bacillus sp. Xin]|uniref:S8 family serine peptidase n=1 Tax=Bacillus sp. Xin TaxID=2766700 RepID=UPI001653345E